MPSPNKRQVLIISPNLLQIAYSVTISQEQGAKNGTSAPANQSAPKNTQTAENASTSAAETNGASQDPRGKKRKAAGEASSETVDLEYAEEEETVVPVANNPAPVEADDSEDIE